MYNCDIHRMDSQLAEVEIRSGVKQRWKKTDDDYIETRSCHLKEKITQSRSSLWSSIVRRHYLLRLKAKYAGIHVLYIHLHNLTVHNFSLL